VKAIIQDVRHAWRSIVKMPVMAAVVVVSLGVGIGANTAVFSWIQALVLQPLPGVADAGRLYVVEPRAETNSYPGVSWPEFRDIREQTRSFPDLLAFRMVPFNVGEPGRVERTVGLLVSGNYFSVLGLKPALGRFLRPDEVERPGTEPVVVISHDYWRTHFSAEASVLGRTIRVNDRLLSIIGVAPERFQGTTTMLSFALWVPATLAPLLLPGSRELEDRTLRGYSVLGRLAPGTAAIQAQADLDRTMRQLAQTYPETNATLRGEVLPFWQSPRGPQRMFGSALVVLQGIMLLLLLAVVGNTANLMLARATTRQREVGVRLALGAGPWRIISLLLAEHLVLAVLGAALGAVIAAWATVAMRSVPILGAFPIKFQTSLDGIGLAFAMLLGIVCGLLFGLAPALQLARVDPQLAMRAGSRTAGRSAMRNGLMAVQVGLALVVLMAAGLFVRNFTETRETDPGFRREGVLLAAYDLGGRNLGGPVVRDFTRRLLERLRALPNVDEAAIATSVPLDFHGLPMRGFTLEGHARTDGRQDQALTNTVTPDYFKTMGIPWRNGPGFADLSDAAMPPQAVVNEEFVRRFLEGAEPLGRRVQSRSTTYVIAGVVRNSLSESFSEPPTPVIYLSYRDRPVAQGEIHVRTRAGAESLLGPEIERIVRELDPVLPVYDIRTLADHVEKNLFFRRIPARMFVVLGPLLLVLAAIGIYAVVAYTVSRRTTEIGVRLALGATPRRVVRQIVGESLRVIGAGAMVGWAIALIVDLHLLRGVIYLSVFAGVPAVLLLVATVACWLPAKRATEIDPLVALRHD
jgi:putative ABC transport system permease protein